MGFFSSIKKIFSSSEHIAENSIKTEKQEKEVTKKLSASDEDKTSMIAALRQAEPKLSAWLSIILHGISQADDRLWQRIEFLLDSLEAPKEESEKFIVSFRKWIDSMNYNKVEEFRSELQYRLALALDMEDEEDERNRLLLKVSEGLAKTRAQFTRNINALFISGRKIDDIFWEELEETLLMADVGYVTASGLSEKLRKRALELNVTDASKLRSILKEEIIATFKPAKRITAVNPPEVILMIGVNGAGKTTTIAKLAHRAVMQGKKVMLVAADTFRAAATEQLGIWAERIGTEFYAKGHGADPAAVAYEALEKTHSLDTVFIDTAGRLHTKTNLMEELAKMRRVIEKRHSGAPHRTILIIDATTGQNGLSQVKLFNDTSKIDDIILTKLDGTAKGGIAIAIAMQFGLPISYIGLGEKMEDLRPFDAESFASALLDIDDGNVD